FESDSGTQTGVLVRSVLPALTVTSNSLPAANVADGTSRASRAAVRRDRRMGMSRVGIGSPTRQRGFLTPSLARRAPRGYFFTLGSSVRNGDAGSPSLPNRFTTG